MDDVMPKKAFEVMRNITVLQSATFAFMVGIASIILLDKGLDLATLGFWVMLYSASVLLLEVPTGAFADAYGRKKAIIASFVLRLIFLTGLLLSPNALILMALAFVGALSDSFISGSKEAHVVDILSERGKSGYTHSVLSSGLSWQHATFILGSVGGGYLATFSVDYALLLCLVFAIIGLFYSWFSLTENRMGKSFATAEKNIISNMSKAVKQSLDNKALRTIFVLRLLFGFAAFGLFNYWQPVMRDIAGWNTFAMGIFFSLMSIMVIIGSKISPYLKANWNTIILVYLAFSALLFLAGWTAIPLTAAVFLLLWQIFLGINGPISGTIVNRITPSEIRATVLSVGALSTKLGMVLFGFLIFFIGANEPRLFWIIGSGFLLFGALIVLFTKPR